MNEQCVEEFTQILDKQISSDLNVMLEDFPREIFHYTNSEGTIGILSSHKIWATNIGYVNDSSEFIYARDIILKNISEFRNNTHSKDISYFLDRLSKLVKSINNAHINFFIACFCEKGDLLSQWRAYGAGGGCSIGVYTNLIGMGPELNTPPREFDVRPVIYEQKIQNQLITRLIDCAVKYGTMIQEQKERKEFFKKLSEKFVNYLIDYLLIFKNPCFSEEKEWRIIAYKEYDSVKFRTKNNDIVPYIELDLSILSESEQKTLPITKIIVGPSNNQNRAVSSIEWLCNKYEHCEYEIIRSKIPLV